MKKLLAALICSFIVVPAVNCKKDAKSNDGLTLLLLANRLGLNTLAPGSLSLKGKIASVVPSASGAVFDRLEATINGVDVVNVLVYRDFGDAEISPVDENGNFMVNVERKPCGLVFLDGSDTAVGYLSLASGIEAIPLTMVDESTRQIDLQDIRIQDGVATPDHNPIEEGGEIQMTAEEQAVYKLQSSLFSAIIRNLDMNSDGVIDVLSDRPYTLMFGADFDGGAPATSDPGETGSLPTLNVFHFNFSDNQTAVDTPPAILEAPDTTQFTCPQVDNRFTPVYHWVLQNTEWGKFLSGDYTITYDTDKVVTFNVNSPLNSDNYIVAAHLWYEIDGTTITKVHWKWKMLNGSPIDATKLIKEDVYIQFNYGETQLNYHVTPADTECAVEADITSLKQILMSCNDLFGNWQPTFYNLP